MKRTLWIASIVGLFLVTALDLQAHHRRHVLTRPVRTGIAVAAITHAPLLMHRHRHVQYPYHPGRQFAREIRSNERRIWKLQERIARLDRYDGNFGEIRRLEQEIHWLERRNDQLRNRLY